MKIILGSGSRGRKEVLEQAGIDFEVLTADIDEKAIRYDNPRKLVLALAHAKADAILPKIDESALLITADQVAYSNGQILEKPESEAEARRMIRSYFTNPVETVNGVVVTNTKTGKRAEGVDISKVQFEEIPEQEITDSLQEGRIMHCAGAIRCEDQPFKSHITQFDGSEDSTSGMPLKLLKQLIEEVEV